MELATDSKEAAKFINGIVPQDMEISEEKQQEVMKELFGEGAGTVETQVEAVQAPVVDNTQVTNS